MKSKILIAALLTLPVQVIAKDNTTQPPKTHTLFYAAAISDIELSSSNKVSDYDEGMAHEFGYRYQVNQYLAAESRFIKSSSIGAKQVMSLGLIDGSLNYSVLVASGQARISLTNNSYLYGNLGITSYQWEYEKNGPWTPKDEMKSLEDSGIGSYLSVGAKYQWSRVELAIENQWLKMGDVNASNITVSVGYRF